MDHNELYQRLDEEIQSAIDSYPVHEWTLHDMELFVDNMSEKYGDQLISQQSVSMLPEIDMVSQQQFWGGDGRWGWDDSWGRDRRWDGDGSWGRDRRWDWDSRWDRDRDWNRGFFCRNCDFRDYVRLGILRNVFDRRR